METKTYKGGVNCWLVVWNIWNIFHYIWDVILPIDELIFFKMVKTTNQVVLESDVFVMGPRLDAISYEHPVQLPADVETRYQAD